MRRIVLGLVAAFALMAAPAQAGPGETTLRRHLEAASNAQGLAELEALVARRPNDQQTIYALGVMQFVRAAEAFGQGLYRHGFAGIDGGQLMAPLLRLPVAPNPNPEPITYDAFRALVAAFVADLDEARATLARVSSPSVKLRIDLALARLDVNGDGTGDIAIGALMDGGVGPEAARGRVIAFDRADALWMQGYAQLAAAQGDFLLAHDFSALFEAVFHRLFPNSGLPLSVSPNLTNADRGFVSPLFADAIAAVHSMNWPVVEPDRRAQVRERLLAVSALSRANWAAIRAERDNDREWLPNPRQTSPFEGLEITDERIDAWLAFLDRWDAVLNGELLMPHWRFSQGMDMRAFFEGRENFDLVAILTGIGALPYLREGPTASLQDLQRLREELGPQALLFAAWFN